MLSKLSVGISFFTSLSRKNNSDAVTPFSPDNEFFSPDFPGVRKYGNSHKELRFNYRLLAGAGAAVFLTLLVAKYILNSAQDIAGSSFPQPPSL